MLWDIHVLLESKVGRAERREDISTLSSPDGGNFDGWPTTWEEQGRAGRATFSGAERRGDGSWSDRVRYLGGRFGEFCANNLSYK